MAAVSADVAAVPVVSFRTMASEDIAAVLALELKSYTFPWGEGIFRDCLKVGYDCQVIELSYVLAGYYIVSHGAGEAHLLNVCVREAFRGRGIGRRAMLQLMQRAAANGARILFLETRPSNLAAIRLYHALGFVQIGVRPGYYQAANNSREDALTMRRALDQEAGEI